MPVDFSDHVNFEEYFSQHVKNPTRERDELKAECPFHEEENASWGANLKNGLWKCFGCGAKGNIIVFEAKIHGVDQKEAHRRLREKYLPGGGRGSGAGGEAPVKPFPEKLPHEPPTEDAFKYMTETRGWSREVIEEHKIGYVPKEKRITIPVLNEHGHLVNIRRYKPGAKERKCIHWARGTGTARLWPLSSLDKARAAAGDTEKPVILCEGEPDVLCGLSRGLHCITNTAGAGTWRDTFNVNFKGLKVLIAYDADDAGRKGAKRVAKYLPNLASGVEIIQWPEWMKDGEDLTDFFVRHKKSVEDLLNLPRIHCDPPKDEGTKSDSLSVEAVDGSYWHLSYSKSGQGTIKKKISNFTIQIVRNMFFPEPMGVVRTVRLVHEAGQATREAELESGCMASRQAFSGWCLSKGNFVWRGSGQDLEQVWHLLLQSDEGKVIIRTDHIGYNRKVGAWLFRGCAVKDGKIFFPDDDGVIWLGAQGYQPLELSEETETTGFMPEFRNDLSDAVLEASREELISLLKENLGGFEAYLVLGFVAACVYSEEIFREFKFPILFIFGPRQCGKSTLANLIMAHFGLDESAAENVSSVSYAALARRLAYSSGIPMWVDEYRNDPQCQKKDSQLRSAYDRVGGSRGRLEFGVTSYPVRAPLIITGEAFPTDPALGSRCAMIHLSEHRRHDEPFQKILQLRPMLSGIVLRMLREKDREKTQRLLKNIRETAGYLQRTKIDPRMSTIYAILGEAFMTVYNPRDVSEDYEEFGVWLEHSTHQVKQDKDDIFIVNEFLQDLDVLRTEKRINGQHIRVDFLTQEIHIWLRGTYQAWAEHHARMKSTFWSYGDLCKYLKDEPYVKDIAVVKRMGQKTKRCVVLDLKTIPEQVKETFEDDWTVERNSCN